MLAHPRVRGKGEGVTPGACWAAMYCAAPDRKPLDVARLSRGQVGEIAGHVDLHGTRVEGVEHPADQLAHRHRLHPGHDRIVVGEGEELGVDQSGVDHEHLDPRLPEVDGHRLAEGGDRGFRCVIGRLARRAQGGRHRGDVDDPTAVPLDHVGKEGQGQPDRAEED